MGQVPRELTPSLSVLHFFGAELRRWRTTRGLSQDALGKLTHHSGALIGKIEKAARRPTPRLARQCDEILNTGGVLQRLFPLMQAEPDHEESELPKAITQGPHRTMSWSSEQLPSDTRERFRLPLPVRAFGGRAVAPANEDGRLVNVEYVEELVKTIADAYLSEPPMELYAQGLSIADGLFDRVLATGRRDDSRGLHLWAGYLGALLGWIAGDLGDSREASAQTRRGWLHAELADDDTLRAWMLSSMSKTALWDGRHQAAAEHAAQGLRYSGRGTVGRLLACQQADAWAEYGSPALAHQALTLAESDGDKPGSDAVGGLLSCSPFRRYNYIGSVQLRIGEPAAATATAAIALQEMVNTDLPNGYGTIAQVRIWSARARIEMGQVDAAAELLTPVLAAPPTQQLGTVAQRVHEVGRVIASRGTLRKDPTATQLMQAIDRYYTADRAASPSP